MKEKLREWLKQKKDELAESAKHAEREGLSPFTQYFIDGERNMCRLVELQLDIWDAEMMGQSREEWEREFLKAKEKYEQDMQKYVKQ